MSTTPSTSSASHFDLSQAASVCRNPSVDKLIADGLAFDDDEMASSGAMSARSGKYTGRTPKDKFIVATQGVIDDIWWGNNNRMEPEVFAALHEKAQRTLARRNVYVIDTFAGADPKFRIAVRFVVERPYHALFVKQLLIRPSESELADFFPDWTVIDLGRHKTDPAVDHVRGEAVIALNFADREVIIFGTEYAGEMKKSIFSVMNLLLPMQGVMSMHCSANIGASGDTALFFGLSGTGKTTLSADPSRKLIGDDEHGWSDDGVFNIEGGCYAKCIHLSKTGEPEIWDAITHGSVLENVILGEGGVADYDDDSLTENTRAAYPIEHIPNRAIPSVGGHPKNIFFLTCDALGVLPPISRLTTERAMELFLIGYTAKLAGTEVGVVDPSLTFSTCFGSPFLPLRPSVYATLLGEKVRRHGSKVWMVNTGWTGGPHGVGTRMKLGHTRSMLAAALSGELDKLEYSREVRFGLDIPRQCPGVPTEVLFPRETWKDKAAYDEKAEFLKSKFEEALAKMK